jgi:hypothetical protein
LLLLFPCLCCYYYRQDENKFLVQNLVEIKMELAETQSEFSHVSHEHGCVHGCDLLVVKGSLQHSMMGCSNGRCAHAAPDYMVSTLAAPNLLLPFAVLCMTLHVIRLLAGNYNQAFCCLVPSSAPRQHVLHVIRVFAGNHDQAKRALVRAMDKEACLDMRVGELTHMLDMVTQQQPQQQQGLAGIAASVAEGAVSVAESAGAAAAAAITAAGAEYKKTRNRRAARQRSAQGSKDQQQGSASEGASGGASNSEGVSESGAEEDGSSSGDGADVDAGEVDPAVGSHSISASSSGEFSEALSRSSSGAGDTSDSAAAAAGDAGDSGAAATSAAAGDGDSVSGGVAAANTDAAADVGAAQKDAAATADNSSGSDPVGETTLPAGSDSK